MTIVVGNSGFEGIHFVVANPFLKNNFDKNDEKWCKTRQQS